MQVASFGSVQEPPSADDEERIRQEEMDTSDAQFWVIAPLLPLWRKPKENQEQKVGKSNIYFLIGETAGRTL